MFNAVSKASTETSELNSLSSANQALWQQAQRTMADLIAEGLPVDSGDLQDLSAQIKYASEASTAMRVRPFLHVPFQVTEACLNNFPVARLLTPYHLCKCRIQMPCLQLLETVLKYVSQLWLHSLLLLHSTMNDLKLGTKQIRIAWLFFGPYSLTFAIQSFRKLLSKYRR